MVYQVILLNNNIGGIGKVFWFNLTTTMNENGGDTIESWINQ